MAHVRSLTALLILTHSFLVFSQKNENLEEKSKNSIDKHLELTLKFKDQNEWDSLIVHAKLAALKSTKNKDYNAYCISLLRLSEAFVKKTKLQEADSLVKIVSITIQDHKIDDNGVLSLYFLSSGLVNDYVKGDFEVAIKQYHRSLALSPQKESKKIVSDIYELLGNAHLYMGDFDSTDYFLTKSLTIKQEIYDNNHIKLADTYTKVGRFKAYQGDLLSSLKFLEKALKIYLNSYDSIDFKLLRPYINVAVANLNLGNSKGASYYFEKASIIMVQNPAQKSINVAVGYYLLGDFYRSKGEYYLSVEYLSKSTSLLQELSPTYADLGYIHSSLAESLSYIDTRKSLEAYDKALDIINNQNTPSSLDAITVFNGISSVHRANKNYEEALKALKRIDFFEGESKTNSYLRYELIRAHLNASDISVEIGRIEAARKHLSLIEKLLSKGENPDDRLFINLNYAKAFLHYNLNNYDSCVSYCDLSLRNNLFIGNPGEVDFTSSHDKKLLFKAFDLKGQALYKNYVRSNKRNDLFQSSKTFEYSKKAFDSYFKKTESSKDKINSLKLHDSALDHLLRINLLLMHESNADSLKERIVQLSSDKKAYGLKKHLDYLKLSDFDLLPDSLLAVESELKALINYHENKLLLNEEKEDTHSLEDLLASVENFKTFQQYLKTNYPKYADLQYGNNEVKISEIQQKISESTAIIDYVLLDSLLLTTCISKYSVSMNEVKIDSSFSKNIEKFSSILAQPDDRNNQHKGYSVLSNRLYSKLILPIEEYLDSKTDLIIVSDGVIGKIPFETLKKGESITQSQNFTNDMLIHSYNISYLNAISSLLKNNPVNNHSNKMLSLAPSFNTPKNYTDENDKLVRSNISPLNWTEAEVQSISNYFENDVLLREYATEPNFRQRVKDYQIIHLATHGLLDDEDPMLSKIVLTFDMADSIHDGYIHTQELFGLRIPAKMAVLSACHTGEGKVIAGEGILSLARGFFYAGTQSVIMSLWAVNDKSTSTIMGSFYKYLADGKEKHEALRQAKLNYLATADAAKSHPYYWASFIANGDMRPVSSRTPWWPYVLYGLLGLLLFTIIITRKKQNKV